MKNKKAWFRVVEAFIAIVIVLSAVLIIMSKEKPTESRTDVVYGKQQKILEMISKNESLRESVIKNQSESINSFIFQLIPASWNFTTNICAIDDICNTDTPNDRDVYASEILITSTLNEYNPKKLRFFVWMR